MVLSSNAPCWNEIDRLAALREFEILDTAPEGAFDGIAKIAAHVCNAPIALVSFVDERRQWFKSEIGLGMRETGLDLSVCAHAILQHGLFVIPDMARDPRLDCNLSNAEGQRLRFYAGAVLETNDGFPLGTLCVLDYAPRPEGLTNEQEETLSALAQSVMDQLELRRANKALAESKRRFETITETIPQMVWSARSNGYNDSYNHRWYEFTGVPPGSADGEGWDRVVHPDDRDRVLSAWQDSLATGEDYEIEYRLRHHSGVYRWILGRGSPFRDSQGRIERWYGTYTDIDDWKKAEASLVDGEERYRALIEASTAIVWRASKDGSIIEGWGWETFCGQGPDAYRGGGWLDAVHPDDRERVMAAWRETLAAPRPSANEYRVLHRDGQYRWIHARVVPLKGTDGAIREWVGTITDINDSKQAEVELWRAANHDSLTGLPNRVLFQLRLEQAVAEAKQNNGAVSLLLIDLDDFKDVNDTLGHDAGDALLKETAARLSMMTRDCDTVARLGGDEFAVLLVEPFRLNHATGLAESMIKRLRQPYSYAGRALVSRASIGVAAFPDHDSEPVELMKDADIALFRAKAEGRNRVMAYSPAMRASTEQRLTLGREVREAISRDCIVPFYQPKVCLSTGRIIGVEALARWRHPTKGILTPDTFGAAFDDPELATAIGKRLIGKIASDMRRWLDAGINPGRVGVNLSCAEFSQPDLAEDILRILALVKVPTDHFEIEVTEKVLLEGRSDSVSATLEKFQRHGVQIALDDFGTGYASLTHLKRFPVHHIKIDRTFVFDLEQDAGDEAIVAAVIGLGRSLNIQVTAEGVETEGQAQRLRELGCNNAQGYLFAKPMAVSEISPYFSNNIRPSA
jgi:diguanylate cyclase (GGDEF)-like protein/PAS domain S-box-containing protein